ncbi:MAG TPA: FAD-binding oxidoreductase [Gaiellaceae bacterium]|nr:FAD-binding oxidoreductase [Gaiellaceae bacterium]
MTTLTLTPELRAAELRTRVAGTVVFPHEEGWDEARLAWNLHADQRPAAVVFAESAEDVAAVVAFARSRGYGVAPQGTGHFATALRGLDDETILLKTERMQRVEVDAAGRRVRAEAGVIWQQVIDAAAPHGLAALHGSAHDVGVVGYSLGGGIGWYARKHGMAANSVLAFEVVTADGRIVRTDAEHEPELFWALRGGGGSFGIVTAIELALLPITEVYAGALFWPMERAPEILRAYTRWADALPDEVTSCGRLMQFPPIPDVPEHLRGRSFVLVEAVVLGDDAAGEAALAPLRALGPELDTAALVPASSITTLHMDPPHPVPGVGDGTMLAELTDETIDTLVAAAGSGSGSTLVSVELRQLGGALARPATGHGAIAALDAAYAMYAVGMAMSPPMAEASAADVGRVLAALEPWESTRTYFNFTERTTEVEDIHAPDTAARLRALKARLDPTELFRVAHPVAPAQ